MMMRRECINAIELEIPFQPSLSKPDIFDVCRIALLALTASESQ
jgi:hypothetical protein